MGRNNVEIEWCKIYTHTKFAHAQTHKIVPIKTHAKAPHGIRDSLPEYQQRGKIKISKKVFERALI